MVFMMVMVVWNLTSYQGSRKLAPLVPPVPDKPHLVGQNEIQMKK
jgi:hypothetical protein